MTGASTEWIVIADGEHARFLTRTAHGAFHTFKTLESETAGLRSSDLTSDEPGRAFESGDVARHAIAPREDPHLREKHRFAALVAAHVNAAAGAGLFGRLVLVAPIRTMTTLDSELDEPASTRVTHRIRKDLTKVPDGDLAPHLPPWPAG
ncbi:host attachment protein [Humitalea sp. 24SJ18S-53]|uniref:host attachment protein n=1 Tax=Humitalea sp. 24SJ18S-53 TaxID=3422307 RepID=UPI003D66FA61